MKKKKKPSELQKCAQLRNQTFGQIHWMNNALTHNILPKAPLTVFEREQLKEIQKELASILNLWLISKQNATNNYFRSIKSSTLVK